MVYLISNTKPNDDRVRYLKVCDIKFLPYSIDVSYDSIIFTSKNAIESMKFNNIDIKTNSKAFVIGAETLRVAQNFGYTMTYLAKNTHGNQFAHEIAPLLTRKKALYIRAKKTVSKVGEILEKSGVNVTEIIGYENIILNLDKNLKPEVGSTLIFTSPLNVIAFRENFGWDDSYRVICIGRTTADFLKDHKNTQISVNQTIKSCIDLAFYS